MIRLKKPVAPVILNTAKVVDLIGQGDASRLSVAVEGTIGLGTVSGYNADRRGMLSSTDDHSVTPLPDAAGPINSTSTLVAYAYVSAATTLSITGTIGGETVVSLSVVATGAGFVWAKGAVTRRVRTGEVIDWSISSPGASVKAVRVLEAMMDLEVTPIVASNGDAFLAVDGGAATSPDGANILLEEPQFVGPVTVTNPTCVWAEVVEDPAIERVRVAGRGVSDTVHIGRTTRVVITFGAAWPAGDHLKLKSFTP